MQYYTEERAVHLQTTAVVINEAELPEPIHKETDSRTGRPYHLGQRLLTDLGDYSFWYALFAEVSQQKKDSSQSLFAGVEQLIHQILFVTNIPNQ